MAELLELFRRPLIEEAGCEFPEKDTQLQDFESVFSL